MSILRAALLGIAIWAPAIHADVTVRYQIRMQSGAGLRAGAAGATARALPDMSYSIKMKGQKALIATLGMTLIMDLERDEVTMLDAANQRYATVPSPIFAEKATVSSSQMEAAFAQLGTAVWEQPRKTGRTETIHGFATEEREVVAKLTPVPGGPEMKMVIRIWAASHAELLRVPATRELESFGQVQRYFGGASAFPGGSTDALASFFRELEKDGYVTMRMEFGIYMPGIRRKEADADTPFMKMTMEIAELSAAPLEGSLFQIPAGYTSAPFEQIMDSAASGLFHASSSRRGPSAAKPVQGKIRAYVPGLTPLHRVSADYPEAARATHLQGLVEILVTLDPAGSVSDAEAVSGPAILRPAAIDAVKQWRFRPVIRDGQACAAYTDTTVFVADPESRKFDPPSLEDDEMDASTRLEELARSLPRSPKQLLADLEQDSMGGDASRRKQALRQLAKAAFDAGAEEKAGAYAKELLTLDEQTDWMHEDSIHRGHTILGLIALRHNEVEKARQHLLESGKTKGSPVLGSFGPSMILAKGLLEKGERDTVLEYFKLCRAFWESGAKSLDLWSETVQKGRSPEFGPNIVY